MFLTKAFDDNKLMQEIYNNTRLKGCFWFLVGVILQAIAFDLFILPTNLVFGTSGISVILNKLFNVNPAYIILIANILLLLTSFVYLGPKVTERSILGSILYPFFIQLFEPIVANIILGQTETVIIALSGALLYGFGTGLVFKYNYTTGGTNILKQIISKEYKVPIGTATLYIEGFIIIIGVFVLGWQTFIYSTISLAIISWITDRVMIGISENKTFQIITTKEREISQFITKQLEHNVTILNIDEKKRKNGQKILLCSVPTKEYYILKKAILKIDEKAFLIVTDAYEVIGGD